MVRFVKTAAVLCALGSVFLLRGSAVFGPQDETPKVQLSVEQLAKAKENFNDKCSRCHGVDGRGDTVLGKMLLPPDFTNEKWWKDKSDDEPLAKVIINGKDEMPAFGRKLSHQQIADLIVYIRLFNKPAAARANSATRQL